MRRTQYDRLSWQQLCFLFLACFEFNNRQYTGAVIAWKDSSLKYVLCVEWDWEVKLGSLTRCHRHHHKSTGAIIRILQGPDVQNISRFILKLSYDRSQVCRMLSTCDIV